MASPSRSQGAGTYFTTSATWNRRHLFQVEMNAALFLETLQKYRRDGHYRPIIVFAMRMIFGFDWITFIETPCELVWWSVQRCIRTLQLIVPEKERRTPAAKAASAARLTRHGLSRALPAK